MIRGDSMRRSLARDALWMRRANGSISADRTRPGLWRERLAPLAPDRAEPHVGGSDRVRVRRLPEPLRAASRSVSDDGTNRTSSLARSSDAHGPSGCWRVRHAGSRTCGRAQGLLTLQRRLRDEPSRSTTVRWGRCMNLYAVTVSITNGKGHVVLADQV